MSKKCDLIIGKEILFYEDKANIGLLEILSLYLLAHGVRMSNELDITQKIRKVSLSNFTLSNCNVNIIC